MELFSKASRPGSLRDLTARLDHLEQELPKIVAKHSGDENALSHAFVAEADAIEQVAVEPDLNDYVEMRIDAMLQKATWRRRLASRIAH